MSDGRLLLEAKEDMKKRGMPSPDEGDAVALCFSEPEGSPIPQTQRVQSSNRISGQCICLRFIPSTQRCDGQRHGDPGQFTTGYYTLADDVLTMTDSKGRHVRSTNGGDA